MDSEKRQNYNKQYYQNHKVVLLEKLTKQLNCEFCNRQVSFCNLQKHITLPICKNTQAKNDYMTQRKNNI